MSKARAVFFDIDHTPVSYTHLDVYKRQIINSANRENALDGEKPISKRPDFPPL